MKGLGAEGDDVSEVVLAVDAMMSAWCGWYRGGGGGDQGEGYSDGITGWIQRPAAGPGRIRRGVRT